MKPPEPAVQVDYQSGSEDIPESAICHWCRRMLGEERTGQPGILNVIFVDDSSIRDLNRRFLNHDRPTDVIAFFLEEAPEPEDIWGEVYIGWERAREQAREYRVAFSDEVARLVIHGVLHLLGWDDETDEKRLAMRREEDRWLARFSQDGSLNWE